MAVVHSSVVQIKINLNNSAQLSFCGTKTKYFPYWGRQDLSLAAMIDVEQRLMGGRALHLFKFEDLPRVTTLTPWS